MRIWSLVSGVLVACGPTEALIDTSKSESSESSAGRQAGTDAPASDSGPSGDSTSSSTTTPVVTTAAGESADGASTDGGAFLTTPDAGPPAIECDVWQQDCPPGEKCLAWNNRDGDHFNATRCSPVVGDPDHVGEQCRVFGGAYGGADTCDVDGICYYVDPQTDEGTCVGRCLGDETSPQCQQPNTVCPIGATALFAPCLPTCHPLAGQCGSGQNCVLWSDLGICIPAGTIEVGESCERGNACVAGATCYPTHDCDEEFCCASICDLTAGTPNPSCRAGESCTTVFDAGAVPDGFDSVGVCDAS